jgi:hypothetical protein
MKSPKQIPGRALLIGWLTVLSLFTGRSNAPAAQETAIANHAPVELVLSGPSSFGSNAEPFTAMLINRSGRSIVLLPPNINASYRNWTSWMVHDAQGFRVGKLPKTRIYCVGTTMYEETQYWPEEPDDSESIGRPMIGGAPILPLDDLEPVLIRDEDLVVLEPGEKLNLSGIVNPMSRFQITKPGTYKLTLHYEFIPSGYRLAENSKKKDSLKNAVTLDVTSNALSVALPAN